MINDLSAEIEHLVETVYAEQADAELSKTIDTNFSHAHNGELF